MTAGGHFGVLLDRLDNHYFRDWHAHEAATHGRSRNVLEHQIKTSVHTRLRAAPSNFSATLSAGDSDLAQQLSKDPYVFDFLALDGDAKERHLEQALVDLLFFHVEQLRYVVIELKTGKFKPEYIGQLGFYVALIDDRPRRT